jgi:hypothetical protein
LLRLKASCVTKTSRDDDFDLPGKIRCFWPEVPRSNRTAEGPTTPRGFAGRIEELDGYSGDAERPGGDQDRLWLSIGVRSGPKIGIQKGNEDDKEHDNRRKFVAIKTWRGPWIA